MVGNRWYDKKPELGKYIDRLKEIKKSERDSILLKIKDLIIKNNQEIVDKYVFDFPITMKRRWYDKDPYSWLTINSLKFADGDLVNKVVECFKKNLG